MCKKRFYLYSNLHFQTNGDFSGSERTSKASIEFYGKNIKTEPIRFIPTKYSGDMYLHTDTAVIDTKDVSLPSMIKISKNHFLLVWIRYLFALIVCELAFS